MIRNEADLAEVREYILNNPTRWDEDDYNPDLQRGWTGLSERDSLLPSLDNVIGELIHGAAAILVRQILDIAAGPGREILGHIVAIL